MQLEVRRGNPRQPYEKKKKKKKPQRSGREYDINRIEVLRHDEMLAQIAKRFWETSVCVYENSRETAMSTEEKQYLKVLKYGVSMLRKQVDSRLPNNYEMALRRLRSFHQRFFGNPDLYIYIY